MHSPESRINRIGSDLVIAKLKSFGDQIQKSIAIELIIGYRKSIKPLQSLPSICTCSTGVHVPKPILSHYTPAQGSRRTPILASDLITKKYLHLQKKNRLLDAEGNQKCRIKKDGSHAQALKVLVRKSPGPHWREAPRPRGSSKIKDQNRGDILISAWGFSSQLDALAKK